MDEFIKRLEETSINILRYLLATIGAVIVIGAFACLLILLPIWLLSFLFEKHAFLWMIIVLIAIPIYGEWEKIKSWFHWQFIEPFKK